MPRCPTEKANGCHCNDKRGRPEDAIADRRAMADELYTDTDDRDQFKDDDDEPHPDQQPPPGAALSPGGRRHSCWLMLTANCLHICRARKVLG